MAETTTSPGWGRAANDEPREKKPRIRFDRDENAPAPFSQKVRRVRILLNVTVCMAVGMLAFIGFVPIEESYHAIGRVRPAADLDLLAPADLIKEGPPEVHIGDSVAKGEVIMRFRLPEIEMSIQETQGQLEALEAQLALEKVQTLAREKMPLPKELWEMTAQVAQSRANVDYYIAQLNRAQTLAKQGVASEQEVEKARLQYEQAKIEHERLMSRDGLVDEGYGQTLVAEAKARENLTAARIQTTREHLKLLVDKREHLSALRAPVSGVILDMPHKDTIGRIKDGEILAVMSEGNNRLIEIYGLQKNIDKVALGQTVRYRSQVWNTMKFGLAEGRVVLISQTRRPDRRGQSTELFYTILATIEKQPKELPLDSQVNAQIVLKKDRLLKVLFSRD